MIPDQDTNVVYISDLLPKQHSGVTNALKAALGNSLCIVPGAKDIWCRDYMPIQLSPNRFVQFRYDPNYLKKYPKQRTQNGAGLLSLENCACSNLVIDGGNVVRWNDTAVMTDKVYRENPQIPPSELRKQLQSVLDVRTLVMIPKEPDDIIGHSDGIVRFLDHDSVLVNDYTKIDPDYGQHLAKTLEFHGLKSIPFPYYPTDEPGSDPKIPSAAGCYINFLQTCDTICVPAFGFPEDEEAATILVGLFPQCKVIPVPCAKLARDGGVLNCVTWNIQTTARQSEAE